MGALQGGSGGLTGGRVITGLSPGDRTLEKLSYSPERLKITNTVNNALEWEQKIVERQMFQAS